MLGDRIDLYGTPQIMLSITRCADISHTPDVRSRAILPRWACRVRINYASPAINDTAVANLAAAAGITAGIGDWRVEKGSGNYGQFMIVSPNDKTFLSIMKEGRREQDAALLNPVAYDDESRDLLTWLETEFAKSGKKRSEPIRAIA